MPAMIDTLRTLFDASFAEFLNRETANILHGTAERSLCARWAPLLEAHAHAAGFTDYYADTEYNRMQDGRVKLMLADGMHEVRIVCDLILHSRGGIPAQDNLIAIEMKRASRPAPDKDSDRLRLRTLTRSSFDGIWSADGVTLPEYVCGYALGFYAEFDETKRRFSIEEYREGERTGSRTIEF